MNRRGYGPLFLSAKMGRLIHKIQKRGLTGYFSCLATSKHWDRGQKRLDMRSKSQVLFPPLPAIRFSKWWTTNQNLTRHCNGSLQPPARSKPSKPTWVICTVTYAEVVTLIEEIETVCSVLSSDEDTSSPRILWAFRNCPKVQFLR